MGRICKKNILPRTFSKSPIGHTEQDSKLLCEMLSEFSSGHSWASINDLDIHRDGANLQILTRLVPKIMHQNLTIIYGSSITAKRVL